MIRILVWIKYSTINLFSHCIRDMFVSSKINNVSINVKVNYFFAFFFLGFGRTSIDPPASSEPSFAIFD